jgi:hypothetical protein
VKDNLLKKNNNDDNDEELYCDECGELLINCTCDFEEDKKNI